MVAAETDQPSYVPLATVDVEYMSPEWKAGRRRQLAEELQSKTDLAATGGGTAIHHTENP